MPRGLDLNMRSWSMTLPTFIEGFQIEKINVWSHRDFTLKELTGKLSNSDDEIEISLI